MASQVSGSSKSSSSFDETSRQGSFLRLEKLSKAMKGGIHQEKPHFFGFLEGYSFKVILLQANRDANL